MRAHHAANRVLVRMYHDPSFVEAVRADPAGVLGPLGVPEELRAAIAAVDPRAFRVDEQRRLRLVRTLADEFPGSTTLYLATTRTFAPLDGFCSSPPFHAAVQQRGSLAAAFEAHLLSLFCAEPRLPPHAADVVRLEGMKALARREREAPEPLAPGLVRAAPGVRTLRCDGGTLALLQEAERLAFALRLMPAAAMCVDGPALPARLPEARPDAPLHLVTVPAAVDLELAQPGRVVTTALELLATARSEAAALGALRPLVGQASAKLLGELIEAGLVRRQ